MSVKQVKQYYDEICEQYHEMIEELHDFEEECNNNLVDPDRLEEAKKIIIPLKTNYERISYIMFLLNQPNKKEKIKKYQKQNAKLLKKFDNSNSLDGVKEENRQVLKDLKGV